MKKFKILLCLTSLLSCLLIGCGSDAVEETKSNWEGTVKNVSEEKDSYSGSGEVIGQYCVLHVSEEQYTAITDKDVSEIAKALETLDFASKYDYFVVTTEYEFEGIVFPGCNNGFAERGSLGADCMMNDCEGTYEDDGNGNYIFKSE